MGHLQRLREAGEATGLAQICRHGEEEWMSLDEELDHVRALNRQLAPRGGTQARQMTMDETLDLRDARSVKGWESACIWMMVTKGSVGKGVSALILSWIGLPIILVICNFVGSALFVAATGAK